MLELRELAAEAPRTTFWSTYGDPTAGTTFDVELQVTSRSDIERMRKVITKRELTKGPDGQRQFVERADADRFRAFLASCIVQWRGLTVGKAFTLCKRQLPAAQADKVDVVLQLETTGPDGKPRRDNALFMLQEARSRTPEGEVQSFEDWVWAQVTELHDAMVQEVLVEKKASENTSPDTTV